jgi:very-short-patch-repair endonuclease
VNRRQLLEGGWGRGKIEHRLRNGRLHLIYPGVYAVGHPELTLRGEWLAAVMACEPNAVLSHESAAALWGLRRHRRRAAHVTVSGGGRRGPGGIVVHRTRRLEEDARAIRDGIPVTSVERTLIDLAAGLEPRELARALEEADRLHLLRLRVLNALLRGSNGRRGGAKLRELLAGYQLPPDSRSELERRFLELVEQARLPRPATNVSIAGFEVDAVWIKEKLVVELDGFAYHGTRQAFERDRERDSVLQIAGYRVLRLTWRRLTSDPGGVIRDLRRLLAA